MLALRKPDEDIVGTNVALLLMLMMLLSRCEIVVCLCWIPKSKYERIE